tara:strand:+ start:4721 stop:5350 length:630 start_codon:yes stop_codon:yes gene_type:complete
MQDMSAAEREKLQTLFRREGGPSYWRVVGLLNAVATAPRMIMPHEWLPRVIGERELDAVQDVQLLAQLYDAILTGLEAERPLVPPAADAEAVREHCAGYMQIAMADSTWREDEEAKVKCFALLCLAQGKGPSELGNFPAIHDDATFLREARENLAEVLVDLHRTLGEARELQALAAASQPRRTGPQVGRNDPCPCGSGRKYKKCCLAHA